MKEKIIVWISILLLVRVLLYPPYGYTRYTVTTNSLKLGSGPPIETQIVVPWTYLRHAFILSDAIPFDSRLSTVHTSDQDHRVSVELDDMRISWPVMGIEAAIILLITIGSIFTLRPKPVK